MPIYDFKNTETGEIEENRIMSISQREQYLKDNPHMTTHISQAPPLGDPIKLGVTKTPDSFNDLLKTIKKETSKGSDKSTINTR
tara:strand:+ start:111 stop:362 length:252 start_codon:yes stop_codon:yes gene_type:complete